MIDACVNVVGMMRESNIGERVRYKEAMAKRVMVNSSRNWEERKNSTSL